MEYARVGLAFVTCLFLGAGIGLLFSELEIGGAIGFGVGMLVIVLFRKRR